MKSIIAWCRAKWGRLVTSLGGLLTVADLDLSPIKPALEDVLSHRGVQIVTITLFVISALRHHKAAQST